MILVQFLGFVLNIEVFRDPHRVLIDPCVQLPIAHAILQAGQCCSVGELAFVFFFCDLLVNEAPFSIRAARVLDCRIHVDAERVPNATYPQILLKTVVVAVFSQDAKVPFAKRNLVVAGSVIRDISIRDVLDVTHDAVEYLGHLNVGLVVSRYHLAAGPVLALVVGDL